MQNVNIFLTSLRSTIIFVKVYKNLAYLRFFRNFARRMRAEQQ